MIHSSASPVGVKIINHPWESRTGREYFEDLAGDHFKHGAKIIVGGKCYIKYVVRQITGWHNGAAVMGKPTSCWEFVEHPKDLTRAHRLD
jgi:hypothetical protein